MNWQFKKIISIVFAFLVGATIVFFSWKNSVYQKEETSLVSVDNENWRATLSVAPQDEFIKTLNPLGKNINPLETEATTTTTVLGQKLLTEFIAAQTKSADGTISDAEVKRIANLLAEEVVTPLEKQYSLSDLNISSDNEYGANIEYITKINAITKNQLATIESEDEIAIVTATLKTNDATLLEKKLTAREAIWQKLIENLLSIKTPSSVAQIHLHLIQSIERIRVATSELKKMIVDPATGIAALSKYKDGFNELSAVKQEYSVYFMNKF